MPKAPRPTIGEWLDATMALLPRGRAWSRDPASTISGIMAVIAGERQQRHDRKVNLLEVEAFPTTSNELISDWETAAGLPDPCRAVPGTLAERYAALADQFFADHPPTPANMIAWSAQAGWTITIREQRHYVAGLSMAGDATGESDFVWEVTVHGEAIFYFHAGFNVAGDVLSTWPDLSTLECVLRRAAPAHTSLYFIIA